MRKLIAVAILGYLAYAYQQGELKLPFLQPSNTPVISNDNPAGIITISQESSFFSTERTASPSPSAARHNAFRCDGRQHCSQMRSYEEALFFLQNCPNTKMDGDHDGIPCEMQFNRH